jgi:hypothetical protein
MSVPVALLLFPQDWELAALPNLRRKYPDVEWLTEGFDLFKFPQNAQLLWFDPEVFVEKLCRKYAGRGIAAVLSAHEQFGALCAALLAEKLKLPGTPVEAILRAQHKAVAREIHAKALPGCVPAFQVYTFGQDPVSQVNLPYPFFVKPIKAAYSVLAKKVKTPDELRAHTTFAPLEGHIIRRLTKPFNALAKARLLTSIDGDYMMAEAFMQGEQVNVDGFVCNGEVTILGTIDAVMYPGTQAFMRFELPSRIPAAHVKNIEDTARKAITALGFTHGLFNVELFWDAALQRASIIEVNPRVAAQFADMYEKVHGINLFDLLADLSFGVVPHFVPHSGKAGVAASFVYRVFDDTLKHPPAPEQLIELRRRFPDSIFTPDFKVGASRHREQKWLGSHRYALLNLSGRDHDDLMARFEDANTVLDFDQPPKGIGGFLHAIRKGM